MSNTVYSLASGTFTDTSQLQWRTDRIETLIDFRQVVVMDKVLVPIKGTTTIHAPTLIMINHDFQIPVERGKLCSFLIVRQCQYYRLCHLKASARSVTEGLSHQIHMYIIHCITVTLRQHFFASIIN